MTVTLLTGKNAPSRFAGYFFFLSYLKFLLFSHEVYILQFCENKKVKWLYNSPLKNFKSG